MFEQDFQGLVAALADMTAAHATVLRDGRLTDVPSSELVPGDILVLAEGDAVSADVPPISATRASISSIPRAVTRLGSALTGNSASVSGRSPVSSFTNARLKGVLPILLGQR